MEEIEEVKKDEILTKEEREIEEQEIEEQEEYEDEEPQRIEHSGEIITFPVSLKVMDLYKFMIQHAYLSISGFIGIAISVGAFIMLLMGKDGGTNFNRMLLIVAALLFTVINPLMMLFKSWKQITVSPSFKSEIQYTFSDAGAEVAQGEEWVTFPWDSIYRIRGGANSIYVYTSPVRAFILPKSCLAGQFDAVRLLMKRHVEAKKFKIKV